MNDEPRYTTESLARYLKARGIKQRWLARQVGIHEKQVSRWARGEATATHAEAQRVALVLGVPVTVLFPVPNGTDSDAKEAA